MKRNVCLVVSSSFAAIALIITLLGGFAQPALAASEPIVAPQVQWGSKPADVNLTAPMTGTDAYTPAVHYLAGMGHIFDTAEAITDTLSGLNAKCAWTSGDEWLVCPVNRANNLPLLIGYNATTRLTTSLGLSGTAPFISGTELIFQGQLFYGAGQNQIFQSQLTFDQTSITATARVQLTNVGWSGCFSPVKYGDRLFAGCEKDYNQNRIYEILGGTLSQVSSSAMVSSDPTFLANGTLVYRAGSSPVYTMKQQIGAGMTATVMYTSAWQANCQGVWCSYVKTANGLYNGPYRLVLENTETGVTRTVSASSSFVGYATVSHGAFYIPSDLASLTVVNDAPQTADGFTTFTATVAAGSLPITYTWDFGNGHVRVGTVVTYEQHIAGSYMAYVQACNQVNCLNGSTVYTVTAGTAAHITWWTSTTIISAGQELPYSVHVTDRNWNLVTSDLNEIDVNFPNGCDAQNAVISCTLANMAPGHLFTAEYMQDATLVADLYVKVTPSAVVTVSITPSSPEIPAGQNLSLEAHACDEWQNCWGWPQTNFDWTGTVAPGQFRETVTGNYTVTASYDSLTGTAAVHVGPDFASAMAIVYADPDVEVVTPTMELDLRGEVEDQYGNTILTTPYQYWQYSVSGNATIGQSNGNMVIGSCLSGEVLTVTAELKLQNTVQLSGTRSFACESSQSPQYKLFLPLTLR